MFPQQKRRKTLLDFNFKKIRNNDCENVKKSIPVDDLACSKNDPQNVIEEPGETPDADKATKDLVLQPSNDISLCIGKTYTQAGRLRVLKSIWIPDQSFNFPITATNHRNLRFQHRWFIRFKWLAYSYLENGAFCKYCVLFGCKAGSGVGNQPLGTLCAVKFQKWKNALNALQTTRAQNITATVWWQQRPLCQSYQENKIASKFNLISNRSKQF